MIIEFPFPPSTNTYWRNVKGRTLISERGRRYRLAVLKILYTVDRDRLPFEGRLAVELDLYPPDRRRRDVDNYSKALLDALEHAGVYADDEQIYDLHIRKHDPRDKLGSVRVRLGAQ